MTRYAINLSLPLLLLSFLSLLLVPTVAAQETPPCEKALSVQDVVDLLEGHVPDARVALFVTSCGVDFELNAQLEQRLRSGGATSDLIQTIVRNVKLGGPKVTLKADKTEIEVGESVTLTWDSTNATELDLEPDFGSVPLQASRTVAPQKTTTYRLSARGKGGTGESSVRINVKHRPPEVTLQADKREIARGQTVALTWESANATELTLEPGPGKVGASGSQSVSPQRTTRYCLVARGPGGEAERTLTVSVFNPNPDYKLERTLTGHSNDVRQVTFSPNGQTVASSSDDKTIKLWDVATGSLKQTLSGDQYSVAFSPDDRVRAYIPKPETIQLWDVATGRLLCTIHDNKGLRGHFILALDFSPDWRLLASGSNDVIKLWEVPTCSWHRTLKGHKKWVSSIAFSPDGRLLASGSRDHTIKLWEVLTGRELHTLKGHGSTVESVAFSPDGRFLASGSQDHTIKLWDVGTGRLLRTLKGHADDVNSVAFSPDGRLLASGSDDDTVKLWRRVED
jgi:hypothetical protein